ncbi:protease complex subunit PrcB family protein [Sinanaerobacter chloroacetimidivorans]|uniref:Protease complex subunit PrcB family protein n=1 Tax=Sinanaerobacter chloroacetimidivorans TaxID=2818044 RepID=A0A8J7W4R3_9FIRM|nr:protease complex subunit PrcB family protein [Sinanaerobacter chloroacetimidivorans]MBR0598925.1 protease complex subunit PrcB family protein [Sinanaerobacter chloroacetimidivorans]
MSKTGVLRKMRKPNKKMVIIIVIIIIAIVAVMAGMNIFKGDEKVNYKVLGETEIPQQIASQVIPEYRTLERALACMVDDKIYVIASRGEKPTSGYDVAIEKMEVTEEDGLKTLVVFTEFKDPQPGTALTQVLTYPLQVAETDLAVLPDQIELKVQYTE